MMGIVDMFRSVAIYTVSLYVVGPSRVSAIRD